MKHFFIILLGLALLLTCTTIRDLPTEEVLNAKLNITPFHPLPVIDYSDLNNDANLEFTIQASHKERINTLAFSPDGRFVLTGSNDTTVKLWDIEKRVLVRTFTGHRMGVSDVEFFPDGKRFVSAGQDSLILVWQLDGTLVQSFRNFHDDIGLINLEDMEYWRDNVLGPEGFLDSAVSAIDINPDGTIIASCSDDGMVKFWDLETGDFIRSYFGHTADPISVKFTPDGTGFITGSWDRTIGLWNTGKGQPYKRLEGHKQRVTDLAINPQGTLLASSSMDGTIKLWNLSDGTLVKDFRGVSFFENVDFSPDGNYLLCGSLDGFIRIWDQHGNVVQKLSGYPEGSDAAFSPTGQYLAAGSYENILKFWQTRDGSLVKELRGNSASLEALTFSPDFKHLILQTAVPEVNEYNILEDREYINLFSLTGTLKETLELSANRGSIAVNSGADALAYGRITQGDLRPHNLSIMNLHDGNVLFHKQQVSQVEDIIDYAEYSIFSPSGHLMASSSSHNTYVWDWQNRELLQTIPMDGPCVFSPDENHILFPGECWYNLAERKKTKEIKLDYDNWFYDLREELIYKTDYRREELANMKTFQFSWQGDHAAAGFRENNRIKLWRMEDGRGVDERSFDSHLPDFDRMYFSPDDKYLITAASNVSLEIYHIQSGRSVICLFAENEWIMYTPDGYFAASKNGGNLITMVRGTEVFGIDQFAVYKNRPDIILRRMEWGDEGQKEHYNQIFRKRIIRLELPETDPSESPDLPKVEISILNQTDNSADIRLDLTSSQGELKSFTVFVNNVPVPRLFNSSVNGTSASIEERIILTPGENKIEVSCMNTLGAESLRAMASTHYNNTEKGDLYFVGIGVSEYERQEIDSLRYAHKDAADLSRLFESLAGNYQYINSRLFLNDEAAAGIFPEIEEFLLDADENDTFVLFIAGHGVHDITPEAGYYFLTAQADLSNLKNTAFSFSEFENLLISIKPRKKLFLMDTCESGEVEAGMEEAYYTMAEKRGLLPRTSRGIVVSLRTRNSARETRDYVRDKNRYIYNDLLRRSGTIVFSSCRGNEFSYESKNIQNGFFTEEIINCLTDTMGDENGDSRLSIREMESYVNRQVANQTQGYQNPTIDRDNIFIDLSFPVSRD